MLTERQEKILHSTVAEYVQSALPVSSQALLSRYGFSLSSAMVRSELNALEQKGYLAKPHVSAGRIPTDKGYRFFVDEVLSHSSSLDEQNTAALPTQEEPEHKARSFLESLQALCRNLAEASLSLTVVYVPEKSLFWKEGWDMVLRAPEFRTHEHIGSFSQFLVDVERGIRGFHSPKLLEIYIGKENPFSKEKDFSIIISAYSFSRRQKGWMALVGPKRMPYQRNIRLVRWAARSMGRA